MGILLANGSLNLRAKAISCTDNTILVPVSPVNGVSIHEKKQLVPLTCICMLQLHTILVVMNIITNKGNRRKIGSLHLQAFGILVGAMHYLWSRFKLY